MERIVTRVVPALTGALCLCLVAYAQQGGKPETLGGYLRKAGYEGKLQSAVQVLDLNLDATIKDLPWPPPPDGTPERHARAIETSDQKMLRIDCDSGAVLSYRDHTLTGAEHMQKAATVSEERARETVRRVLDGLGLAVPVESGTLSKIVDHWRFAALRTVGGIVVGSVSVEISAATGQVAGFHDGGSVPIPESLEKKVTAEQAVRTAMDFASQRYPALTFHLRKDARLVIMYPNDNWTKAAGELRKNTAAKTRLSWYVALEGDQDSHTIISFTVDCQTGGIIGGAN